VESGYREQAATMWEVEVRAQKAAQLQGLFSGLRVAATSAAGRSSSGWSGVKFKLFLFAGFGFGEPATTELLGRNAGHVGFNVEDRSAVEHVDAVNMELRTVATEEFDDSKGNRIRTARGPGCEDAVGTIVGRGRTEEFVALGAVESPDDEKMRKAFDVSEAGFVLGKDFEDAFFVVLDAEAFRYGLRVRVWTANIADGFGSEHEIAAPLY
jgi:hypothetical protein